MDTLSLILDDIRLHGAVFREVHLGSPWSLRLQTPGLTSFHIIARGSAWLLREGEPPLALQAGDIVLLPDGLEHCVQHAATCAVSAVDLGPELQQLRVEPLRVGSQDTSAAMLSGYFRFDVNLARPLIAALPPLMHLRSGSEGAVASWLRIGLQFIAEETLRVQPGQQVIINRVADILLVEVLRHHVQTLPEGSGNWLLALRDKALSAVLAAMHGSPERDWSVPQLAAIARLSRSAFADRFGQVLGKPPLSYLTEHRMRLAAWKLAHTRLSVAQIAEQVGYGSETAFSQAFKRHYGEPPSKMRSGENG